MVNFLSPRISFKCHTPLSGEGVPSPCSVSATGPVSRNAQEFGISQACRFCNVRAGLSSSNLWGSKVLAQSLQTALRGPPASNFAGLRLTIQHSQASEAFWQLAGLRIASQLAAHVGLMWTHLALMWAHLALMWTHLALMWTHLALVWTHLRFLATRGPTNRFLATRGPTNRFLATRRPTNRFLVARRPTKSLPRLIWHSCVEPSGRALTALMKHQLRYGTCCTTCSTTGNTTKRVGCDQFLSYHV